MAPPQHSIFQDAALYFLEHSSDTAWILLLALFGTWLTVSLARRAAQGQKGSQRQSA